jgi:hypothetical protein
MFRSENSFSNLVGEVKRGDAFAQNQLRRKLAPDMVFIVRRALQDGRGRTALDRRILAEARRAGWDADLAAGDGRDRLVDEVVDSICDSVLAHLRPRIQVAAEETICETPRSGMWQSA